MPDNTELDPHPEWTMGGNPAAIEQQEREGQQQLVRDGQLPTKLIGCVEDDLRTAGITLGELVDGDPLFRHAQLPDGWTIRATDHPMWSELVRRARGGVVSGVLQGSVLRPEGPHHAGAARGDLAWLSGRPRSKAAMEQAQRAARRAQLAAWRRALAHERREHNTSLAAASGLTEGPA